LSKDTLTRRDFLLGATAATAGMWLIGQELFAAEEEGPALTGPPVGIGVIGLGVQGKDILAALGKLEFASVVAICDTYEPYTKRAAENAPKATVHTDYRKLLEQKEVEAVVVATPSHLHKQIVLDALQAGKHVYCEAPIAITVDEAREIALAGKNAKSVFQAGLQLRGNKLHKHVLGFVKTGVPGSLATAEAHWRKKQSWKRMAPTSEREAELNWRLNKATSSGLLGEIGIHQIDLMNWYLDSVPSAVTALGGVMHWKDGREVADTVQCLFEYPKGIQFSYNASLVNSYNQSACVLCGSEAAIWLAEQKAWLFKEADSAMLGWEVYAHKEKVGDETGIALVADATKLLKAGKEPGEEGMDATRDALSYSLEEFVTNIKTGAKPTAGPDVAYQSAVAAIKANEALLSGGRIEFQNDWFTLG